MLLVRPRPGVTLTLAGAFLGTLLTCPAETFGQDLVRQLIGGAVKETNAPEYRDVQVAVNRFRNRDFAGATELLEAVVRRQPELPPTDVMLARLYLAAQDRPRSRQRLEAAVRTHPKDPEAYLLLGDNALQQGHLAAAEMLYRHSVNLLTDYDQNPLRRDVLTTTAHASLATVAERREDWADARTHLQAVLKVNRNNPAALARLARALFLANPTDEAVVEAAFKLMDRAGKLAPTPINPEVQLASLYHQAKNTEKAREWFSKAIQKQPKDLGTLLTATRWATDVAALDLAREHMSKALELAPESFEALMLSGFLARSEKDYATAQQHLEAAHLLRPSEFEPMNQLALSLIEQNDEVSRNKALAYAQLGTRMNPDLSTTTGRDAAVTLAWVLFQTDRRTQAQRTVQEALRRGSPGIEAQYLAARMLFDSGQSESVKELLTSCLSQDRGFPHRADAEALLKKLP